MIDLIWPPIPGLYFDANRRWVWRIEVGARAAARTQTLQRDMRWWKGLWR